jgi:hypothetical protein
LSASLPSQRFPQDRKKRRKITSKVDKKKEKVIEKEKKKFGVG